MSGHINSDVKTSVINAFGPSELVTDDVVERIVTLQLIFNLNIDEIFVRWETYNINEVENDLELNLTNLEQFQTYLQKELALQATKSTPAIKKARDIAGSTIKRKPLKPLNPSSPTSEHNSGLKYRKLGETPFKTPGTHLKSSPDYKTANNTFQQSPLNPVASSPNQPQDSNTVLEILNDDVPEIVNDWDGSDNHAKFKITTNFDASKYKFRTMSMKLLESADVLDEQIDSMCQIYLDHHKDVSFSNPCLSTQSEVYSCGRIVPDSPLYDKLLNQNLNATSLYLETSRLSGIGQRVPLDLTNLQEYSLFPGQIVCVKGKNPSGKVFIVEEILPLPELGAPVSSSQELEQYAETLKLANSQGLKFVVGCGPFSNLSTLDYHKFDKFIDTINQEIKPDVVILFGPFVDINNKAVVDGDIELPVTNLDEVFKLTITPILKKLNSKIQAILIPSLKDASTKHCSYPQDSFDRKALGLPKNIKMFPNPAGFAINEILFGCSNLDVFKDLKDISKHSTTVMSNRFERIINHIFEQRRYYPTFPGLVSRKPRPELVAAYDGVMAEEVADTDVGGSSLEVSYMGLAELGDSLPDVLICPSELKYFAKIVKNVIVLNPGSFIRPYKDDTKQDGTYIVMDTRLPNEPLQDINSNEPPQGTERLQDIDVFHDVFKRSRIAIYKS